MLKYFRLNISELQDRVFNVVLIFRYTFINTIEYTTPTISKTYRDEMKTTHSRAFSFCKQVFSSHQKKLISPTENLLKDEITIATSSIKVYHIWKDIIGQKLWQFSPATYREEKDKRYGSSAVIEDGQKT